MRICVVKPTDCNAIRNNFIIVWTLPLMVRSHGTSLPLVCLFIDGLFIQYTLVEMSVVLCRHKLKIQNYLRYLI